MSNMLKMPVLLIGGGGHCASVIDVIEAGDDFEVAGIVEAQASERKELLGYPVVGTDAQLPELLKRVPNCVITVGQIRSADVREKLYLEIKRLGGHLPNIISPLARVARSAEMGDGNVVMHHAIVNHFAKLGNNTIINHRALVEHDAMVGDHCHVSTGAIMNGGTSLGAGCMLGSAAVMIQGVSVIGRTLIGAGAVVTESIEQSGTYIGCPARLIGERK